MAVRRSGDACQSACCQTHPGDSENHMTRTGAGGFYRSVPDRRDDDTPTGTEKSDIRVTQGQVHHTSLDHKTPHSVGFLL